MSDPHSPFEKIVIDLGTHRGAKAAKESRQVAESPEQKEPNEPAINKDDLMKTTLPLLCKLHERGALPVILFNYDRRACEKICRAVTSQLEAAENAWKDSSTKWTDKVAKFDAYQKAQKEASLKRTTKQPKKKSKDDDGDAKLDRELGASDATDEFAGFDPEAPVDGYHFADKKKSDRSLLDEYYADLKRLQLPEWLVPGLQRGIGVHHAGMNRKYRHVVEILFRKGFLRVVIATGTLALGINMPCKTVVFSGDSVFLTALNFRQAAGRAGRRGFDLLGNVVFQGISR